MAGVDNLGGTPVVNRSRSSKRLDVDSEAESVFNAEYGKGLLRFSTAGSVDDGKSTLIGRLLYDSDNVYDDHIRSITRNSAIDFAQLTDGLRAEREQGITIEVAYRYFSTPKRKFIIADTPGHEQYTRNMATGASTADVAIVLLDARKGILAQTRRHACIAALLGIRTVIAAVNKMDLVDFAEHVFDQHRQQLAELALRLEISDLIAVPVCALEGDNVVHRSSRMRWYDGPSLLELLETVPIAAEQSQLGLRLPVQYIIRPHQDFRGLAGQIAAGNVCPGDDVLALPSGIHTRVRSITVWDRELTVAHASQSIVLALEDEIDVSRGDMIVSATDVPHLTRRIKANVVWMNADALRTGRSFLLKHTTRTVSAKVVEIRSGIDMEQIERRPVDSLELNDIGEVVIETSRPLMADLYRDNRTTGSFILIRRDNHATAGAGMISGFEDVTHQASVGALVDVGNRSDLAERLEFLLLHRGCLVVRTRIADRKAIMQLAHADFVVIVESAEAKPIVVFAPDDTEQILAESDGPEEIVRNLFNERLTSTVKPKDKGN